MSDLVLGEAAAVGGASHPRDELGLLAARKEAVKGSRAVGMVTADHASAKPQRAKLAWSGAISARVRSDLGPTTGAYGQSVMAVYNPGPMWVVDGLVVGSTTHNGPHVNTGRITCH